LEWWAVDAWQGNLRLRQRQFKIAHTASQKRMATVVSPESAPVGL
jgi:hypothetical protein